MKVESGELFAHTQLSTLNSQLSTKLKGLVIKNTGSWYLVKTDEGKCVECKIKGNFRLKGIRSTNPVAVGDYVQIILNPEGTALISEIEDRKNYIIRRASNLSKQSHILAANLDQSMLIVTVNYPETSTTFIDRFLATAEAYRIPVCIVINKSDTFTEEDREYAEECFQLVSDMEIPDVVFTGRINIRDYLGRMDVTILTSISEGQPLTILESYAAHKPVIATDVGNCYGLIYGESDDFGAAGIVTHIMNIEEIAQAMLDMAANEKMRLEMGETGYRRVMEKYRVEYMQKTYWEIYRDFAEQMGLEWKEESVKLPDKEK